MIYSTQDDLVSTWRLGSLTGHRHYCSVFTKNQQNAQRRKGKNREPREQRNRLIRCFFFPGSLGPSLSLSFSTLTPTLHTLSNHLALIAEGSFESFELLL